MPDLKKFNFNVLESQIKLENSENALNIVQITNSSTIPSSNSTDPKDICLTYEDGECLSSILASNMSNLTHRLMNLLDIALGLKAMHSCSIAHTQLTLNNVYKVKDTCKIGNLENSVDFSLGIPKNWKPMVNTRGLPPELSMTISNSADKYQFGLSVDIWNYGLI